MTSDSQNTVYVITGGNRGIGLGLVSALLARPATSVVTTVRGEEAADRLREVSQTMKRGDGSQLYVMILDFTSAHNASTVRERFLATADGINHIDVVICAAGFAPPMVPCLEMTTEDLQAAFEVNAIGPLTVFQGCWPLMERRQRSSPSPKFIVLSSSVGSIESMEPAPGGAYGASKAAVNWIVKSLHEQMRQRGLVSVALHPGWVRTSMGEFVAEQWHVDEAPMETVEQSVKGILGVIDKASRENFSGRFVTQEEEILLW